MFNIREDPTETNNLAASQTEIVKKMKARIAELGKTVFRPQAGDAVDPEAQKAAVDKYGGFVGPWLDLPTLPAAVVV